MLFIYLQKVADKLSVVEHFTDFLPVSICGITAFSHRRSQRMQFPTFVLLPKKPALNTPLLQGREVIIAALAGELSHLDTTHSVSNARASVDGDKAHLDALGKRRMCRGTIPRAPTS